MFPLELLEPALKQLVDKHMEYATAVDSIVESFSELCLDRKWREWNSECQIRSATPLHLSELLILPLMYLCQIQAVLQVSFK